MEAESAILWDVVEQNLDEAEYLVEQWAKAARSARLNLGLFQKGIERRLIAHLDALAVHGQAVADRLLWPILAADADGPADRVTAAALALLIDPQVAARDRLIATMATTTSKPVLSGLRLAMQITRCDDVDVPLRETLYTTAEAANQTALLAVLAARRVNPGPS